MRPLFIDTTVLTLAIGQGHPRRTACREVLRAAAEGRVVLHASVEAGQEMLYHRVRRAGVDRGVSEFDAVDPQMIWHDFTAEVLRMSRDLIAGSGVRGRDAVHAATAILAGFDALVTADADFDQVPGLRRLSPEQALEV